MQEYKLLCIEAETLGEAWEQAVRLMMRDGVLRFVSAPEYQTQTKDCPMFISVRQPLKEPRVSPKAPVRIEELEQYAKHVLFGMEDPERENQFDYTYYGRFRSYPDCELRAVWPNVLSKASVEEVREKLCGGKCNVQAFDQVQLAIDTLRRDPTRRSVVLCSWIVSRDSIKFGPKREKTSSPCIVYIQPQIVEAKLHLFVVMKTNDLFNAWPGNAYAMTELQRYMAERIGVGVGTYNHFSVSMQIYQDAWSAALSV